MSKIKTLFQLSDSAFESNLKKMVSFDSQEKLEKDIVLNNESQEIDVSYIDNIRTIIFYGDSFFKVAITSEGQTITYNVEDLFLFNPMPEYMDTITSIEVANTDSVDVLVHVRAYGQKLGEKVATPTIQNEDEDAEEPYTTTQTYTITVDNSDATIRYTIDGTDPTRVEGEIYQEPINITETTTIKAIAYKKDHKVSDIAEETITIEAVTP